MNEVFCHHKKKNCEKNNFFPQRECGRPQGESGKGQIFFPFLWRFYNKVRPLDVCSISFIISDQDGINKKNSLNVGESLLPSLEHVTRCLRDGMAPPIDLAELSRDDEQAKVDAFMARLRNRAEDAFFEIGSRLIEGRRQPVRRILLVQSINQSMNFSSQKYRTSFITEKYPRRFGMVWWWIFAHFSQPPEPYFKNGERIPYPHQSRFSNNFLVHLEKHHRSGHNHEWIGQLVFAPVNCSCGTWIGMTWQNLYSFFHLKEPTIKIQYTLGDRGQMELGLKDSPKIFFRDIRRRAYGFLFGGGMRDFASDTLSHQIYVRELDYAGKYCKILPSDWLIWPSFGLLIMAFDCSIDWLIFGTLISRFVGSIDWLIDFSSVDYEICKYDRRLIDWFWCDWLFHWCIRSIDWLIDWLGDWLIESVTVAPGIFMFFFLV